MRRAFFGVALLAALTCVEHAQADIDVARALGQLGATDLSDIAARKIEASQAERRFPVLVRHSNRWVDEPRLISIAPGFSSAWLTAPELAGAEAQHPAWRFTWAPPRHALLDRAGGWTRAQEFREEIGGSGAGAIVGVIDTGIDPAHRDFRRLDGSTRIAWLLDFSRPPNGLHPELEERYGCTSQTPCAIYSASDLDAALAEGRSPSLDGFGHGTHVASLAAGNGLSTDPSRFVGVAPEAQLIIVRGDREASGSFFDADILTGTAFVFERAQELGLPAVLNLSLGSDFGPHDGSSALEEGLTSFIGEDQPGRAIVVAAGNSGSVYVGLGTGYPDPLGIHTEVHVPHASSVRVPVLTPKGTKFETKASVFIWITSRPGDELRVGLDDADGEWIPPLSYGKAASFKRGAKLTATIFNGVTSVDSPLSKPNAAVVVLDGTWPAGETFGLRLEGHGSAAIWLQGGGDLGEGSGSIGPLVPRAIKQGTISLPASHPELIAVGASLNRLSWRARSGAEITVSSFGSVENPALDGMGYFSSSGPNADGVLKPDIVAPGAFLVAAMSSLTDPARPGGGGMFGGSGVCSGSDDCLVVDDFHAVSTGTSMSAPQVAGAIALLFERDPSLTQRGARALLQAGARRLEGAVPVAEQAGIGGLDVMGALEAQLLSSGVSAAAGPPDPGRSWLAVASSFVYPDSEASVEVYADLRTENGHIADSFAGELKLTASNGVVKEQLARIAPGLWRARVAGGSGRGGDQLTLQLRFDQELLLERRLPIAVDPHLAINPPNARGGCTVQPTAAPGGLTATLGLAPLLLVLAARRRRSAAPCIG